MVSTIYYKLYYAPRRLYYHNYCYVFLHFISRIFRFRKSYFIRALLNDFFKLKKNIQQLYLFIILLMNKKRHKQ